MKKNYGVLLALSFLWGCASKAEKAYLAAQNVRMTAPILECTNPFFTDSVRVTTKFDLPDAEIRYNLDQTHITEASPTFHKPLYLKESTTIQAKVFHPEYQSSPTTALRVLRTNSMLLGSTITITPKPSEPYQANGAQTLTDHRKGSTAFANGNAWLGFQSDTVAFKIDFKRDTPVSKVILSTLLNHGAWIFLPKHIRVLSGNRELGAIQLAAPAAPEQTQFEFIEIPLEKVRTNRLEIMVTPLDSIPQWHQGKGTPAWFFIDEILVE